MNVATLLARSAATWPSRPAVAEGERVLHDYASFAARVAGQAAAMRAAGLAAGDRVALVARNHPAYLEAMFACWWAGLIAVPVNAKLHPKELAKTGIRVNCVTPAAVKTGMFAQMTQQHIDFMLSKIPMGRFGAVDEIAALVSWLASEDCSFSTGAVFDASGGRATY